MRDQLLGVAVFWHEDEAFFFPDRHATARSTNAVRERLPQSEWWAAVASMSTGWRPLGHATTRQRLRSAGWHFKRLSGYEGMNGPVALPIALRSQSCTLSLRTQKRAEFPFPFATTVDLTGDRLSPRTRVLFEDGGWKEIARAEFEARGPGRARSSSFPTSVLVLLLVWLGFLLLKVGGVARGVVPFFGLRRRLVKSVATTMSFPPAIPEQFPALDRARLEASSRDLEGLGFEKLLDTAPVADTRARAAASEIQLARLGDYPRIAEERRAAGLGPGFRGAALLE